MFSLVERIEQANRIAIGGHVRPDGDCVGSCMGLYSYITNHYSDKKVSVFLEEFPHSFDYLYVDKAFQDLEDSYDLFISLDCGDLDRLGDAARVFGSSTETINIDHHVSNPGFAQYNHVEGDASSTCEVLCKLLPMEKIGEYSAKAFYTGIIHDTGVFKHSNTSKSTMKIAGELIEKNVPFGTIIDESFYQKTYKQLQLMGRCLLESVRIMDGKCIFSIVTQKVLDFYEAEPSDLDGVIDQMRTTEGVEVAILIDERAMGEYKVSMRSNQYVNVSKIATFFGGGGHVRAAGCTIKGSAFDVINNITEHIEKQLEGK